MICRQLGYHGVYEVKTWGQDHIDANKPIHLDNMECQGDETNIGYCVGVFGTHNCQQIENAGVICMTDQGELVTKMDIVLK